MKFRFYSLDDCEVNTIHKESQLTSDFDEYAGDFKAVTDLLNPTVVFKGITLSVLRSRNYVIMVDNSVTPNIEIGGYFITGYKVYPGTEAYELSLKRDVLYTYRDNLDSQEVYVERCSNSSFIDTTITDSMFPTTNQETEIICDGSTYTGFRDSNDFMKVFLPSIEDYRYIFVIQCRAYDGTTLISGFPVNTICTNLTGCLEIMSHLNSVTWGNKPLADYIVNAFCLPVTIPNDYLTLSLNKIDIPGSSAVTLNGNFYVIRQTKITCATYVPVSDVTFNTKKYKNWQPFTNVFIDFLPFGKKELDAVYLYNGLKNVVVFQRAVVLTFEINTYNGECSIRYGGHAVQTFDQFTDVYLNDRLLGNCKIGIDIPLASETFNALNMIASGLSAVTSIAGTVAMPTPQGVASSASSVANFMTALQPNTTVSVNISNIVTYPKIIYIKKEQTEIATDIYGEPVLAVHEIDDFSYGDFIKVGQVHLNNFASKTELDEIESLLKEGVHF